MLLGEHTHTLDVRNRLTLPAVFRESLGERMVVTRGPYEGCCFLYALDDFRAVTERLDALPPLQESVLEIQRLTLSSATEVMQDNHGRITIPPELRYTAGIEKHVVVAGIFDHVEVWNHEAWREELHRIESSAIQVADRLAGAGIRPTAERVAQLLGNLLGIEEWRALIKDELAREARDDVLESVRELIDDGERGNS